MVEKSPGGSQRSLVDSSLHQSPESGESLLLASWLFEGIDPDIKLRLIRNPDFMINGGLSALSLPPVEDLSRIDEIQQAHVMRSLASWNTWMRHKAYKSYECGGRLPDFLPFNPEEEALCEVYLELYRGLLANRDYGVPIEELALLFYRPIEWGLKNHLPMEVEVERYCRLGDHRLPIPFGITVLPDFTYEVTSELTDHACRT